MSDEQRLTPSSARMQVLAAALLFSSGGAAIKAVTLTGWQVASLRSGIAAAALLLLVPAARQGWGWRPLTVAVAHGGTMVLFVLANKLTTSANSIFLQSTAPLYVLLLGPLLLRESTRRRDLAVLAALAVGFACLMLGAEDPQATAPSPVAGNWIAAASGLCWAFTVLGLRWMGRSDLARIERGETRLAGSTTAAVVAGNALACLVTLPFALPLGAVSASDLAVLCFLGVIQIGLAYALLARAFRHVRAQDAALLLLVEPVLNPVWAFVIHGERPGPWSMVGGGVILCASLAQVAGGRNQAPRPSSAARPA